MIIHLILLLCVFLTLGGAVKLICDLIEIFQVKKAYNEFDGSKNISILRGTVSSLEDQDLLSSIVQDKGCVGYETNIYRDIWYYTGISFLANIYSEQKFNSFILSNEFIVVPDEPKLVIDNNTYYETIREDNVSNRLIKRINGDKYSVGYYTKSIVLVESVIEPGDTIQVIGPVLKENTVEGKKRNLIKSDGEVPLIITDKSKEELVDHFKVKTVKSFLIFIFPFGFVVYSYFYLI